MFSPQEIPQANEAIQSVFPLDWKGIGVGDEEAKARSAQERARIAEQTQNMMPSGSVEQDGSLVFDLSGSELAVITTAMAAGAPFSKLSDADMTRLKETAEAIREATGQDNWIARWSDEETILALLQDADMGERGVISQLYRDQYGISLVDELKRSMSGADEDRALNLLNRKDGSTIDLHAATIHTDLIDIDQKFFGRKRSQLETEIRNIFAGKNSGEIAELEREYRAKFGVGLREQIASSEKMSQATKDAIGVYFKGVDGRTDADIMQLAESALQTRNVGRFQEAMRDAGAEARQRFLNEGGAEKILEAFGVPNSDDINGGYVQTKDSLNALDYAEHGKLSAAQQVRDNTGVFHFTSNTNGIEAAIGAMTLAERQNYELGKGLSEGRIVDTKVFDSDRRNALAFYEDLNGAMRAVGNQSELLAWEDQICNKGGTIVSALARHRGTIYDDSVDEMCSTVENMSQSDWERLKDPLRGGEFRQEIEAMLNTYASKSETARVMEIVDKKVALSTYSQAAQERRSVIDALADRTHWFSPNDHEKMIDDIANMSAQEQERYKNDSEFRKVLDEAVEDKMSGTAEDAARGLLLKVLRGEKPEQDLVTKLQLRASDTAVPSARVQAVIGDLEECFKQDPSLRERVNNPQTPQDVQLSQKVRELACRSLPENFVKNYINPMIETGGIDLQKLIALDLQTGNADKIFEDLAGAPEERRQEFLAQVKDGRVWPSFSEAQNQVAINLLKQGQMEPADDFRAKIVGWGQHDKVMTALRSMNPAELEALKCNYAAKYSEDLVADLLDKLGGSQKREAQKILFGSNQTDEEKLFYAMQEGLQSHSGFGAGYTDAVGNVGTGYQIDAAINDTIHRLSEAAKNNTDLTDEELQALQANIETSNRNYAASKTEAAEYTAAALLAATAVCTGGATLVVAGGGAAAATGTGVLATAAVMAPVGAVAKFGTKALIMGSDYDYSLKNVTTDLVTGGINGGVNALSAGSLGAMLGVETATMGAMTEIGLSATVGAIGSGTAGFADAVARERSGDEILRSTVQGAATGFVFAGGLSAVMVGAREGFGAISRGLADDAAPAGVLGDAVDGAKVSMTDVPAVSKGPLTGPALLERINAQAKVAGEAPEFFAVQNLTDPGEIAEFARDYYARHPYAAMRNLEMAYDEQTIFKAGTADAWKAAMDEMRAQRLASVAPAAADVPAVADAPAAVSGSADDLKVAKVDAPTPAIAPEIAESVAGTQGIVNAAAKSDAVIPMRKQLYNVQFEQVTEPGGRMIQTLENRVTGELAPQGSWIATRLDAAGKPVIEDGIVNSWPMEAAKVTKTYNVTIDELQATTRLIAPTRVDGPTVHMVQLTEPISITTKWGPMKGKAGDWLANYDFNPVTGQAGRSYAIISAESYSQTYQPLK